MLRLRSSLLKLAKEGLLGVLNIPLAAKAAMPWVALTAGLKSRPFKAETCAGFPK